MKISLVCNGGYEKVIFLFLGARLFAAVGPGITSLLSLGKEIFGVDEEVAFNAAN